MTGSDLLGDEFFRALHTTAVREQWPVTTALDGSRAGLNAVRDGRAQLAVVAVPRDEEPSALAGMESVPVAWHRVVVLVPATSPLEQVTFQQLAGIFGREAPMNFNRWGDLGLADEWAGSPITAHAPAVGTGLTLDFFRQAVLHGSTLKNFVGRFRTLEELSLRLAGESRAIAVAATPLPVEAGAKVLAVGVRAGDPSFRPTPENLDSGDYPLGVAVRAVFPRDSWTQVAPAVRFVLSDAGAAALERAGLAVGTSAIRRRHLDALEKRVRENLQK